MYRTLLCLGLILAANGASAQVPRKKACDFLTQADISAVLGVAVGSPGDPRNEGKICQYSPQRSSFAVNVQYSDARDPDAIAKALKNLDANTYQTATPVPDVGDAALFVHLGTATPATKGSLTVYVGGTMTLMLYVGTLDQLRALALKALGGSGRTGFAYNAGTAAPNLVKPATPSATSASPLDQLKADLARKAEAGDARAALALADVYRYGNRGNDGVTKPDYAAAMYLVQERFGSRCAAGLLRARQDVPRRDGRPSQRRCGETVAHKGCERGLCPGDDAAGLHLRR